MIDVPPTIIRAEMVALPWIGNLVVEAAKLKKGFGDRLLFDELDEGVLAGARPKGLALPALDRLRSESLAATRALPPTRTLGTARGCDSAISGRPARSRASASARRSARGTTTCAGDAARASASTTRGCAAGVRRSTGMGSSSTRISSRRCSKSSPCTDYARSVGRSTSSGRS